MSQGSLAMPTTGTISGLTFSQNVTAALDALVTCSSGSTAPVNAQSGAAEEGQFWLNTTVPTAAKLQQYTGGAWVTLGVLDVTNGVWTPPVAGGALVTVNAAATVDLGAQLPASVNITDAAGTSITSFGSSAVVGTLHFVTFLGASPSILVYNSTSMILPSTANIQTAAGDTAIMFYKGGGNWQCISYQKASGAPLSTAAVGAAQLVASAQGMNAPLNLRLNASIQSSQLVISLATAANGTPSNTSPVLIPFRDPTLGAGDPIIASIQGALSISLANGNLIGLGTGSGKGRLWVCAYYNGGSVALGVFNAQSASQIFPLVESQLVNTAASTNGGTSTGTHYANVSSISSTPFRVLGYLDWNTASTNGAGWGSSNNPDSVVLHGPGGKLPGDLIQTIWGQNGTFSSPGPLPSYTFSNSAPTTSQGVNVMSQSITPTSAANRLVVDAVINWGTNSGNANFGFLTQDAGTSAIAVSAGGNGGANYAFALGVHYEAIANLSSTTTFKAWSGGTSGANFYFNGENNAAIWGGLANSYIRIQEIMG